MRQLRTDERADSAARPLPKVFPTTAIRGAQGQAALYPLPAKAMTEFMVWFDLFTSVITVYVLVRFTVGFLIHNEPFWIWDLWKKR